MENVSISDLHTAVISGDLQKVKDFLKAGVDLNGLNKEGNTPLMEAVRHGHPEIGFILMEAGANLNVQNADGNTALHLAVDGLASHTDKCVLEVRELYWFLRELYGRGALPLKNKAGLSPLMMPFDESLRSYAIMDFYQDEARNLSFSCDHGDYCRALMLYHGGDENAFSELSATSEGSKVLTQTEANQILENRFYSALRIDNIEAIKGLAKHYESIKVLIKSKSVVNFLLTEAAPLLPIDRVKRAMHTLKELGVNFNMPAENRDTPLRICMVDAFHIYGSTKYPAAELLHYLLVCGADPNRPSGMYSQGWGDTREFFRLIRDRHKGTKEQALAAAESLLQHGVSCGSDVTGIEPERWLRSGIEHGLSSLITKYKTPNPKDLIDQALITIIDDPKNMTLVAAALAQDYSVPDDAGSSVSVRTLFDGLKVHQDSLYATHHLAYLLSLSKSSNIKSMPPLTPEQQKQVAPLIIALSDADFQHSLRAVYARGGADGFLEGESATKIQQHVRGFLSRKGFYAKSEAGKEQQDSPDLDTTSVAPDRTSVAEP